VVEVVGKCRVFPIVWGCGADEACFGGRL